MALPPDSSSCRPRDARAVVRSVSTLVMLIAVTVLVGWSLNLPLLTEFRPGAVAMVPNTAITGIVAALALSLASPGRTRRCGIASRAAAVATIVIAGATLAQYVFQCDLGIDELLFEDTRPVEFFGARPGRMSPPAAMCFILMGASILLLPVRQPIAARVIQGLTLSAMLIAGLALMGYAYGIKQIYLVEPCVTMALPTGLAIFITGVGILFCREDFHVMAPVRSRRLGGVVARTLFPAVVGLPFVLDLVQYKGLQYGVFQADAGLVVNAVSMIIAFGVLVWFCARSLDEADLQRELARKAEDELRALSRHDPLTNLLNRRRFWEHLDEEWTRMDRYGRPLSVLTLDVDFFKRVNDTYGHQAGDDVLCAIANLLQRESRPTDAVCRYGGEEFSILLPETTAEEAASFAERLRAQLADTPIEVGGRRLLVSGSFGVAQCRDGEPAEAFLNRADQALLCAKRTGRNRVVRASSLDQAALDEPELALS